MALTPRDSSRGWAGPSKYSRRGQTPQVLAFQVFLILAIILLLADSLSHLASQRSGASAVTRGSGYSRLSGRTSILFGGGSTQRTTNAGVKFEDVAARPERSWSSFDKEKCFKSSLPIARARENLSQMCRPYHPWVWHITQEQLSVMQQLVVEHGATIPSDAVPDSLKTHPLLDEQWTDGGSAKWTIDTRPASDGLLHVLVSSVPCAKHGCCALPWSIAPNSTYLRSLHNHFYVNEYEAVLDVPIIPKYVMDAGGVGMAAVFFALVYPEAKILRVEPDVGNFMAGAFNSRHFPNILQINLGLWDHVTQLQLCEDVTSAWGPDWPFDTSRQQSYVTREPSDPPCARIAVDRFTVSTIPSIVETYGFPWLDFLKMDVEGAEQRIFSDPKMLALAHRGLRFFIAETHDRMRANSFATVQRAFMHHLKGYREFVFDENIVYLDEELLQC